MESERALETVNDNVGESIHFLLIYLCILFLHLFPFQKLIFKINAQIILKHYQITFLTYTTVAAAHLCPIPCDILDYSTARFLCPLDFSSKNTGVGYLPFPPQEDLSNRGIELASPLPPAWQADSLPLSHQGKPTLLLGDIIT